MGRSSWNAQFNWSMALAILAMIAATPTATRGQATIRSRDPIDNWSSAAPTLLPNAATATASVPSWNAESNAWRLGVAIENVGTGVTLTEIEPGLPAANAGLQPGDVIVNVEGFQVGYLDGALFDLGDEIQRRADQQGRVDFLVFEQRNRRLKSLPITLMRSSAGGVRGEVVCRERITLSQQAMLTVRLKDVTYPNWKNVIVGKHEITNLTHPPIPFAIEVGGTEIYPDHKYALDAWLVDRGQIVLQSQADVPVQPLANTQKLQLNLVRVGTSVPPNTTYAVGQLDQITKWFRQYLRRDPSPQELAAWQAHLQSGHSPQDVLAFILGSPEYFDRMGNQRDVYLAEVYRNLMGRQPTAAEMQQFTAQYQRYAGARTDFVRDVLRMQPAAL